MAALTQERQTPNWAEMVLPGFYQLGVKAAFKIWGGSLVVVDPTNGGFAVPGSTKTGLVCVGRAESTVDNTVVGATDGGLVVAVRRGIFHFDNSASVDAITAANFGQICYIVDDHTVALTSAAGTRSVAGKIEGVDSTGVWVACGFVDAASVVAPELPIQKGTVTLVAGVATVNTGITVSSTSEVFLTLVTPGAGTNGSNYKISGVVTGAPGTGAFTVTAVSTTGGATVNTDVSVLNYTIIG